MDPNQRKTLEIAYEAVNMAGIDMPSLKRQSRHIGEGLKRSCNALYYIHTYMNLYISCKSIYLHHILTIPDIS